MNFFSPKGLLDLALMACVGFLVCIVALTFALCLLARIWYWILLLIGIGICLWLLTLWLRGRYGRC